MPSLLEERLLPHQNPEKSRQFNADHWLASRDFLSQLARQDWLKNTAHIIHVVGSNGKGSTAHYLAGLYRIYNKKNTPSVGLYTSPHLRNVHERIKVNDVPISDQDAASGLDMIQSQLKPEQFERLTYFEILTILALYHFKQVGCELIVLEAGLGGRLDATRMAAGQNVVLTGIDLEHSALLGDDHASILREKLGILTTRTQKLFIPEQIPELTPAELDQAVQVQIEQAKPEDKKIQVYTYPAQPGTTYLQRNCSLARFVLNQALPLNIPDEIRYPAPPGRLECRVIDLPNIKPLTFYFDTAHNPAAIKHSLDDLARLPSFPGKDACHIVLGLLRDRDALSCLQAIKQSNFQNCTLLTGPELAEPPPESALGDLQKFNFKLCKHERRELEIQLTEFLKGETQHAELKWVVICGSHRHYTLFEELFTTHA